MFGTSISPSDRNAREAANKQAMDFLYGRSQETAFSWNLYDDRSARAGISSVGGFIPGFVAPFTGKCARSSDCGQGFFCDQGICRAVGTGNTGPASDGGCSTGPNENEGIPTRTCGSRSGTGNLGGCASPGCGYGGPDDCDGGGGRCCRFTGDSIACFSGGCPEPPAGACSTYCSGYRSSYGSTGPGCSPANTCSECFECVDNNCEARTTNIPCHCSPEPDANCGRPDEPWECCNYKDTCNGREALPLGQTYCYPMYRVGIPRCYDPNVPCDSPPKTDCAFCENYSKTILPGEPSFSLPPGCKQTGFIRNEATGAEVYLYQCCLKTNCGDEIITTGNYAVKVLVDSINPPQTFCSGFPAGDPSDTVLEYNIGSQPAEAIRITASSATHLFVCSTTNSPPPPLKTVFKIEYLQGGVWQTKEAFTFRDGTELSTLISAELTRTVRSVQITKDGITWEWVDDG